MTLKEAKQLDNFLKALPTEETKNTVDSNTCVAHYQLFTKLNSVQHEALSTNRYHTVYLLKNIVYNNTYYVITEKGTRLLGEGGFSRLAKREISENIIKDYKVTLFFAGAIITGILTTLINDLYNTYIKSESTQQLAPKDTLSKELEQKPLPTIQGDIHTQIKTDTLPKMDSTIKR